MRVFNAYCFIYAQPSHGRAVGRRDLQRTHVKYRLYLGGGAFRFSTSLGLVLGYVVLFTRVSLPPLLCRREIHRLHRFPINNDNPAIRLAVFAAIVLRSRALRAGPASVYIGCGRVYTGGRLDRAAGRPSQPGPFVLPCISDRASSTSEMKLQKAVSETE